MWKLRHREVKSFVWGYTALTHHSQYLNPSDLGLFTWQHQVLASRHPGPSTWEGTAPEHFLPSLASAYDVESAYDVRGRTPAPPLKAVQSLPTILYTLLSSPWFSLPSQNFSFLWADAASHWGYSSASGAGLSFSSLHTFPHLGPQLRPCQSSLPSFSSPKIYSAILYH